MSQTSRDIYRENCDGEGKPLVTIDVIQGEEYRVQCGDAYDKNLFFHSAYRKAAEIIKQIHRANQTITNTCGDSSRDGKYPNNIVMFCANRGGGKSSALLTFGKALREFDALGDCKKRWNLWGNGLEKCYFVSLDVIDPTLMGPKDSFMRLLLSKMFVKFRKTLENSEKRVQEEWESRELRILSLFRTCQQYLDVLTGQKGKVEEFSDDLQQIIEIGDSSNLRQKFQELVDLYLEEMALVQKLNPSDKNSYLVIQIDDADLNTDCAYNMIEDLRKYCILPNVVVLMAVHMEQMQQIVEQHFADSFGTLLSHSRASDEREKIMTVDDCREMAMRYMDKVMPAGHQIHLPQIDQFIRNESARLTVRYLVRQWDENSKGIPQRDALEFYVTRENGKKIRVDGYQERLLRLVYEKTGIILVKPATYLHNLLPQNMRELTHFLSIFCRLENINHTMSPANMCSVMMQGSTRDEKEMQEMEKELQQHLREINRLMGDNSGEISSMKKWMQGAPTSEVRSQALAELKKREENLRELEEYFFNGWCTLRLEHKYNKQLLELRNAVATMKNSVAMESFVKPWKSAEEIGLRVRDPALTERSYAQIQACLSDIFDHILLEADSAEKFRALYGVRFYYTVFLHREALASLARVGNLSILKQVMNYEAWSPWYRDLTGNAGFGRFQVQASALAKLMYDGNINRAREAKRAVEQGCIIRRGGYEVYPLNDGTSRLLKRQDITVVYDLGIFLLNYVCRDAWKMEEREVSIADGLLQLLLNWDVQHQVEKVDNVISRFDTGDRGQTEGESNPKLGLADWSVQVIEIISGYLKEKTYEYLPFKWRIEKIDKDDVGYLNDLAFTNYGVACQYVSDILGELAQKSNAWEMGQVHDENPEAVQEMFENMLHVTTDVNRLMQMLQKGERYSKIIQNFCDVWQKNIMDIVHKFPELLQQHQNKIQEIGVMFGQGWVLWTKLLETIQKEGKWKNDIADFIGVEQK